MRHFSILIGIGAAVLIAGCSDRKIADAENAVRAELRDPQSAQFQNVRLCGKGTVVTGDVNSKNGFGGYIGFKPFYYADGDVAIDPPGGALFDRCIAEMSAITPNVADSQPTTH